MKSALNPQARLIGAVLSALASAVVLTACQDEADSGLAVKPVIAAADFSKAAGPDIVVQSGAVAPLNCIGPVDSSYQWVIESNGNLPLELTSDKTAKSSFTAPIVQAPTVVALVCRMTVTNTVAATATSIASTASTVVTSRIAVTINPLESASTLVTTITGNKTANPGSRLSLNAKSGWLDNKAAPTAGPVISYSWTVGPNAPAGTVVTPASGSELVDVIIPTAIPSAVFFPVTVTTTSGSKSSQASITVLVDPAGPLNLAVNPQAQVVQGGSTVNIDATSTATGGSNLFYQWTIVNGPTVPLGGAATSKVGFVAPKVIVATNMTLRVAIAYAPITAQYPGIYFLESVVTVNP